MPQVEFIIDAAGHKAGDIVEISERAFQNLVERGKAVAMPDTTITIEEPIPVAEAVVVTEDDLTETEAEGDS